MIFRFSLNGKCALDNLNKEIAKRIIKKMAYWESTGNPLKYATKISGSDYLYRYRIGNYRVITYPDFKKDAIIILEIGHRRNIYDSLKNLS